MRTRGFHRPRHRSPALKRAQGVHPNATPPLLPPPLNSLFFGREREREREEWVTGFGVSPFHEAKARLKAQEQTSVARVDAAVGSVLTRLRTALALYSHPWAMLSLPFSCPFRFFSSFLSFSLSVASFRRGALIERGRRLD